MPDLPSFEPMFQSGPGRRAIVDTGLPLSSTSRTVSALNSAVNRRRFRLFISTPFGNIVALSQVSGKAGQVHTPHRNSGGTEVNKGLWCSSGPMTGPVASIEFTDLDALVVML